MFNVIGSLATVAIFVSKKNSVLVDDDNSANNSACGTGAREWAVKWGVDYVKKGRATWGIGCWSQVRFIIWIETLSLLSSWNKSFILCNTIERNCQSKLSSSLRLKKRSPRKSANCDKHKVTSPTSNQQTPSWILLKTIGTLNSPPAVPAW